MGNFPQTPTRRRLNPGTAFVILRVLSMGRLNRPLEINQNFQGLCVSEPLSVATQWPCLIDVRPPQNQDQPWTSTACRPSAAAADGPASHRCFNLASLSLVLLLPILGFEKPPFAHARPLELQRQGGREAASQSQPEIRPWALDEVQQAAQLLPVGSCVGSRSPPHRCTSTPIARAAAHALRSRDAFQTRSRGSTLYTRRSQLGWRAEMSWLRGNQRINHQTRGMGAEDHSPPPGVTLTRHGHARPPTGILHHGWLCSSLSSRHDAVIGSFRHVLPATGALFTGRQIPQQPVIALSCAAAPGSSSQLPASCRFNPPQLCVLDRGCRFVSKAETYGTPGRRVGHRHQQGRIQRHDRLAAQDHLPKSSSKH